MPSPVSLILKNNIRAHYYAVHARTTISPWLVNLIALLIILMRIWRRRVASELIIKSGTVVTQT